MARMADREGVRELEGGVLYKVLAEGSGSVVAGPRSIVTVHYTGTLVSGTVFDDSRVRPCPEAFRVDTLIEGLRTALCHMRSGDRWQVFVPWQKGYGRKASDDIPGCSALVFDIELINVE